MQIRAQMAMVLNLDKCIGCHTCSVTCKNVWTSRKGVEYAWFNNVETKPGIGYPDEWENQDRWKGGWKLNKEKLVPKMGSKTGIMKNIFANPNMPLMEDYYEPFTFNYSILHQGSVFKTPPSARPHSLLPGNLWKRSKNQQIGKITWVVLLNRGAERKILRMYRKRSTVNLKTLS